MTFQTPILLMVFNREATAVEVMKRVREARPAQLFVAADGPRDEDEAEVCSAVRERVMRMIDWPCEVKTLFREKNLGCGKAASGGITWFFEHVESGIVLEDDCVPSRSFFPYCEALLKKFENDPRVMMVSGFNALGKWNHDQVDYFFSEGSIWGWASWRRAWELYDFAFSQLASETVKEFAENTLEGLHPGFNRVIDAIRKGDLDTWDYQWHFARLINDGLSVTPARNLIRNIGFNAQATHTKWIYNPFSNAKTYELSFPLRDNPEMILDRDYQARAVDVEKKEPSRIRILSQKIKGRLRKK